MKKIEIDINNNKKYAISCLLFDRQDFLRDVENIRKEFKIIKLFPYNKQSKLFSEDEFKDAVDVLRFNIKVASGKNPKRMKNTTEFDTLFNKTFRSISKEETENQNKLKQEIVEILTKLGHAQKYKNIDINKLSELWNKYIESTKFGAFESELKWLCEKYQRPGIFKKPLALAILTGKVTDSDIILAMKKVVGNFDSMPLPFEQEVNPLRDLAIVYDPNASREDIIEAFKKSSIETELIFYQEKGLHSIFPGLKITDKELSNIKRDREWYWQHKDRLSYHQIALKTKYRGSVDVYYYEETVRKAIKNYEKRLGQKLYRNFRT